MTPAGWRVVAVAGACTLLAACSSGSSSGGGGHGSPVSTTTSESSAAAVQQYLAAVNALCDDLLPKVLDVIKGGHPDVYPVAEYFAELPAHSKLLADFDAQLAKVPVPPAARAKAAAFSAYVRFANELDAKRLSAAKRGQAAFDKEIRAENATADSDPSIAARTAAGFTDSCNAR